MDKSVVLIIEDDSEVMEVLVEIVTNCNFEVAQATNGKEAYELVVNKKLKPALVLCDLHMPVMDGNAFIKKNNSSKLGLNICVITANNDASGIMDILSLGVIDYISKPFDVFELEEKIKIMVKFGEKKMISDAKKRESYG